MRKISVILVNRLYAAGVSAMSVTAAATRMTPDRGGEVMHYHLLVTVSWF